MTIAVSAATPVRSLYQQKPIPSDPLFCFQDKFRTSDNVVSLSASANYVGLRLELRDCCLVLDYLGQSGKPIFYSCDVCSFILRGIVRCATIEEIEAEKSLIEKDVVEYYGTPVSLNSIAQVSTPDASSILVQPYDKSSLRAIEVAIVSSDVRMTPNNDGEVIRLAVPQLMSDRRKILSVPVLSQICFF